MFKFLKGNLRLKIMTGFLIVVAIMFVVTFWSVYNFYRLNESIKLTMSENYSSIIAAENMNRALDEQLHAIVIIFNEDPAKGRSLFEESKNQFYYWYQKARESAFTDEEKILLDNVNSDFDKFQITVFGAAEKLSGDSSLTLTGRKNFLGVVNDIKNIKRECNRIYEINHILMNSGLERVNGITSSAVIFMIIALIGGSAISFVFIIGFSNYISKPLRELTISVEHISEGNFDERLEITDDDDEINLLASKFNVMSEKLLKYERMNVNKILFEKSKSELVIESINEPVMMLDFTGKVVLTNKSFKEVFGENSNPVRQVQSGPGKDTEGALNNPENLISIKDSEGKEKFFKPIISYLNLPDAETRNTVVVFNDITKFQELDRMKSEFVAKVSHELKTPLTSLGMALGLLEDGIVGSLSEKQTDLVRSMKEDYNRLNKLVYEILELTRLESGLMKLKFEKTDLNNLAVQLVNKLKPITEEKGIQLNLQTPDSPVYAEVNSNFLLSAFENIVMNSIRFTDPGGSISLFLRLNPRTADFIIEDTGKGIKPENLDKIFDKFVQLDESTRGSVGLGLTIAKEIVEIHKGEISVASVYGKGTTFNIGLPLNE